ncbi:MAG TPA: type I restriction-modification system subunit M [Succinivibrionaceae bacterium]|nr:type I restriction-modification system subunit M [Succinivibrionaceae bacterium]
MKTSEIVQKLWNLCNVLRDDGITYQDYVTELTYILFLKMAKETQIEKNIPVGYRWDNLLDKSGLELQNFYNKLLSVLGGKDDERGNSKVIVPQDVKEIYKGAVSQIKEPKNLEKIIKDIDALDWFSAKDEGLGDLYEGLLEKNANEKKSGAGQYFTPRPLINVMTQLVKPQPGERCNDPACGTFGFMIAAHQYVKEHTDDFMDLDSDTAEFESTEAFSGCELVEGTHKLAIMNSLLHDINGKIYRGDTLSPLGESFKNYDVVLTNPPFGTKKGGERASRSDLLYSTSNKQLNFLQHIYRSLKANGKARAAVVLPDNVLFADNDGVNIRVDLMDKCNVHTILRLPTGIFYAKGVQTNVVFFTRGASDKDNTKQVWFYDMRSNMRTFGVRTPLTEDYFSDFIKAYTAEDRYAVEDPRWSVFTRDEIEKKGNTLDLGLIKEEKREVSLSELVSQSKDLLSEFKDVMSSLETIVSELKELDDND